MDVAGAAAPIAQSGNNFHCRVAQYFRAKNWAVLMSPYYVDAATDKQREIALIVEHSSGVRLLWAGNQPKRIRVRLFIECKYIANGSVFWFDAMDEARTMEWLYDNTPFISDHIATRAHHYLARGNEVATLFASEKGQQDNDPIFRAVNQCLNGYIYNAGQPTLVDALDNEEIFEPRYPVIVCSTFDHFFRANVRDATAPAQTRCRLVVHRKYIGKRTFSSHLPLSQKRVDRRVPDVRCAEAR